MISAPSKASPPGKPCTPPCSAVHATRAGTSSPPSRHTPPVWSATATMLAPCSAISRAALLPTLPKPCTATVTSSKFRPRSRSASASTSMTPRPVAASRPSEPNRSSGLPVTTPGEKPAYLEYSCMIQPMTLALVLTSGAGMSVVGPMTSFICSTKRTVIWNRSRSDRACGSQLMPPLAPPYGTSTTAVFQVIRLASAAAWSSSIAGW